MSTIRDNGDEITRELRRLGFEGPIEITDTRGRSGDEFTAGTLYLGQVAEGDVFHTRPGDDVAAARHRSLVVKGMYVGQYNGSWAAAPSVEEMLRTLGLFEQ